jgi:hypothetical protein
MACYRQRLYCLRKNPDFEVAQRFNAAIRPFFSVRALAPEVPNLSFSANYSAAP